MTICKGCTHKRIKKPDIRNAYVDLSPQCEFVHICQRAAELAVIFEKAKESKKE